MFFNSKNVSYRSRVPGKNAWENLGAYCEKACPLKDEVVVLISNFRIFLVMIRIPRLIARNSATSVSKIFTWRICFVLGEAPVSVVVILLKLHRDGVSQ